MIIKLSVLILSFYGICISSFAQIRFTGVILDSEDQTALSFVNIGIKRKNIGTVSMADGTFSINIPVQYENDTLTFSMVGYEEENIPINNIIATDHRIIQLKLKTTMLNPVTIAGRKLVERKFGIENNRAVIRFTDGSINQNDIFEIAQLIKFDTTLSRITSVNLHINQSRSDSGTFRINFYSFDGNRPKDRLIEKSIIQKKKIQEGWLKFDLTAYDIYLKGNFVVSIEFIPSAKKNNPVYYEVKLGGSSKSFVRSNSQGEWSVPPHHYRLFITALIPDDKNQNRQNDLDEAETTPATILFSESVSDSFSIFIHLPKDYAKKKNERFPVLYLLDANVYFDPVRHLLEENNVSAILVGIGYKDFLQMDSLRDRDYLYPKASFSEGLPISGGADNFLKFIETELIPYINKTYRTDKDSQTLMGHSYGGYFVLYTLLEAIQHNNNTFKYYVAASPSLDYSQKYLLKQFKRVTNNSINTKNLLLTYGGKEDIEDGGTGTKGIDNFNELASLLADNRYGNIHLKVEVYPTFGHMETAIPTFTRSIKEMKDNKP